MKASALQARIVDLLGAWVRRRSRACRPNLDLSVALGAAHYGQIASP